MTNTPGETTPESATPTEAAGTTLDEQTFRGIPESSSPARLPLGEGPWHQLARAYLWVRLISTAAVLIAIVIAAVLISVLSRAPWVWIPAGIALIAGVWLLAITPRQVRAYGYRLREDDLLLRRGILWQRTIAVPYGRMQLVDITHGPLDRGFGIAQLKLVTAAASTAPCSPASRRPQRRS